MSNQTPSAQSAPIVEAKNVHKTYAVGAGTLEVLRGVDLSVQEGEFVALCGASGAGKSTLLHLLGGLDIPNEGEVFFDGKNLRRLANSELSRLRNERVGLVFQSYHLLPELSALENVANPGMSNGAPNGFLESETDRIVRTMIAMPTGTLT